MLKMFLLKKVIILKCLSFGNLFEKMLICSLNIFEILYGN